MNTERPRILVTGVAGFLGSHIAEQLLRKGCVVCGVDDLTGGYMENVPDGVTLFTHNITDEAAIIRLFAHVRFDAVIHCAAFASENLSHNCRLHTYRSVVIGSAVLVNAAVNHGIKLFISMSSIAVYGDSQPPFSESMILRPCDPYGAAKACMEADLKAAHEQFGLNYVIFRPHNIIGIRQSLADSTRNVASIFIRQALTGKALTIFGDGTQTRAFSPVGKIARIIAATVSRPKTWNATYNVGGDHVMSVKELALMVIDKAQSSFHVMHLPARNETKHAYSDHTLVHQAFPDFGGNCEFIADTIAQMIEEVRGKPLNDIRPLPRIEIEKNLPEVWTKKT